MARSKITVRYEDDKGQERQVELPAVWEICPACRGEGTSSAYLGAFTSEEWHGQDDDFKEAYMKGEYDRQCDKCQGDGKLLTPNRDVSLSVEQQQALQWLDEIARADAEDLVTRRRESYLS